MENNKPRFTQQQLIFKEMFVGTLVYAVVLGFFNDYTAMVQAKSFSTIFFASVVLQLLTYLVFLLKKRIVSHFKVKAGLVSCFAMVFLVWLVLFLSKFFFVWVIDQIFGDNINIYGFFGIFFVALSATVLSKAADYIFMLLGGRDKKLNHGATP